MDHLAEVARRAAALDRAAEVYDAALVARNDAMRRARKERHGPAAIGKASGLSAESARRIYNAPMGTISQDASRRSRKRTQPVQDAEIGAAAGADTALGDAGKTA